VEEGGREVKATKYKVTIVSEALSLDSIPALVLDALRCLEGEVCDGHKDHEDGDSVAWSTEKEEVVF
jgi:hypothetical protein